ncbi:src-like-adapter 2 [Scleropages formosus]|nr:src-like-adapter 2 [Scleropages formosus]
MGCCLSRAKLDPELRGGLAHPAALDQHRPVIVSLYNYPSGGPEDSAITLGERLNILSDEGDWWRVSSSATGKESYVPSSYTAKVFHRWLFQGITREKAEQLLLLPHNQVGSFLIRESYTHAGAYSLSVRRNTRSSCDSVKHYRIHRLPNGWLYISPGTTFSSLFQLVDHYSEVEDGLCCILGEPCFIRGYNNVPVVTGSMPTPVRKPPINWKEVDSSMIFSQDPTDTEDTPVSEGLREAINSYLLLTDEATCDDCGKSWKT